MKKYLKFLSAVFVAVLILISYVSCADYLRVDGDELSTGHLLSPEDVSNISELFDEEPAEKMQIDENTVYYWTKSGSKFHIFIDCQSLSRSDPDSISSGSLRSARSANKTSPCSFCLKRGNLTKKDFSE